MCPPPPCSSFDWTRRLLLYLLLSWATLSTARLIFDLIGRLWLTVIFDFLQVVCCIMGLFGVLQSRRPLVQALIPLSVLSIAGNVLILLWYVGSLGNRSQSEALSLGLPYSYSFFLRHTPGCGSNFDLLKSQWIQNNCILPYYYIESVQALLHAVLAVGILVLSSIYLCQKVKAKTPAGSSVSSRQAHNEAFYSEINRNNKTAPSSATSQETVNGYLNSSFTEEEGEMRSRIGNDMSDSTRDEYDENRQGQGQREQGKHTDSSASTHYGKRILPLPRNNVNGTSRQKVAKAVLPMPHPTAPTRTRLFKKANHKESRRSAHLDDELDPAPSQSSASVSDSTSSSSSSRLTPLVSFDPRNSASLHVQEHYESESEEDSDGDTVYEKIRRDDLIDRQQPSSPLHSNSHDSVPSTLAPILILDSNHTSASHCLPPSIGDWPKPPARMDHWKTASIASQSPSTSTISSPAAGLSAVRQIEAWNRRLNADSLLKTKRENEQIAVSTATVLTPPASEPPSSLQSSIIPTILSPGIRLAAPVAYGLRSQLGVSQRAGISLVTSPSPPPSSSTAAESVPPTRQPRLLPYKSSFRVESRNDNKSVVGFYHSPSELSLKKEPKEEGRGRSETEEKRTLSTGRPLLRTVRPTNVPTSLLRLSSDHLV